MAVHESRSDSPYPRDNWWYSHHDDATVPASTPDNEDDTSPAARTEIELSTVGETIQRLLVEAVCEVVDPQTVRSLHADGEATLSALPSLDKDQYIRAVHVVLTRLGVQVSTAEAWLTHARRLYRDPHHDATAALLLFVRHKHAYDAGDRPSIPD